MSRVPVSGAGQTAESDIMVGSKDQMIEIIDFVVREFFPADAPRAAELVAEKTEGGPRDATADYFLVTKAYRARVRGVVGKVGKLHFAAMVRTSIRSLIEEVNGVWPADWMVVAAGIDLTTSSRLERRAKEDPARAMAARAMRGSPVMGSEAQKYATQTPDVTQVNHLPLVEEDNIVLRMAITDLSQREMYDPLSGEVPGNKQGGFYTFGETGRLKDLPRSFRAQREEAKEIIAASSGEPEPQVEITDAMKGNIHAMGAFATVEQIARAFGLPDAQVAEVLAVTAEVVERPTAPGAPPESKRAPKAMQVPEALK